MNNFLSKLLLSEVYISISGKDDRGQPGNVQHAAGGGLQRACSKHGGGVPGCLLFFPPFLPTYLGRTDPTKISFTTFCSLSRETVERAWLGCDWGVCRPRWYIEEEGGREGIFG
jgi:hypothetical protein